MKLEILKNSLICKGRSRFSCHVDVKDLEPRLLITLQRTNYYEK